MSSIDARVRLDLVRGILAGSTVGLLALTGIAVYVASLRPAATAPTAATSPAPGLQLQSPKSAVSQPTVQVDTTPARLIIPRIAVDSSVEARGLNAQKNLDTPQNPQEVAWFRGSPAPGVPGNAIINGHLNWWTGSAVFGRLAELVPGDEVTVVRKDGGRTSFKVRRLWNLPATARDASLFAPSSSPTLTLITCAGPWDLRRGTDTNRLLVTATLA
jgi:sortase (surface protein transpeptidase)